MAVSVTFELLVAEAVDYLESAIATVDPGVRVVRTDDGLDVVVAARPKLFSRKPATERLQAVVLVNATGDRSPWSIVSLESRDAEPWLYRRLLKVLDTASREHRLRLEATKRSPFTMDALLGMGTRPDENRPDADEPDQVTRSDESVRPPEPGAFRKARDSGTL